MRPCRYTIAASCNESFQKSQAVCNSFRSYSDPHESFCSQMLSPPSHLDESRTRESSASSATICLAFQFSVLPASQPIDLNCSAMTWVPYEHSIRLAVWIMNLEGMVQGLVQGEVLRFLPLFPGVFERRPPGTAEPT